GAIHEYRKAQPSRGTDCQFVLRRRTESVPDRSAIAAGGLSRSAGPFARKRGKILCRLRRNGGAARLDQSARRLRKQRRGLRILPATSTFHFPEKPHAGATRRNCRYQTSD